MAYEYKEIMQAAVERLQMQQAEAVAELEAARLAGDPERTMHATDTILDLDARFDRLNARANQMMQPAPQMPGEDQLSRRDADLCRRYGVSPGGFPSPRVGRLTRI
jgi:hypothetical protein